MQLNRHTRTRSSAGSCRSARSVLPNAPRTAVAATPSAPPASCPLMGQVAALLLSGALVAGPSDAAGLESISLPALPTTLATMSEGQRAKLQAADEAFAQSGTLKKLLQQSEENKSKNRKEIQNKYCYRQAELGIGDCGGLNLVPGMTKNGKQKTPEWLQSLLGVKVPDAPEVTLDELLQRDFTKQE